MKNILVSFIRNKNKCTHKNALLNSNQGYCPDCGQYLVKSYYLVRCSCCDIKREAKLVWGEVLPIGKYCSNCGSREFYIEKLDVINFVDAKYAVYIKEIANEMQDVHANTQIWVDDNSAELKQIAIKN